MIGRRSITILILAAAIALLPSCIDSHEEYWIGPDGAGRAEINYQLPAAAALPYGGESGIRDLINSFLTQTPEITTSSCEVTSSGDRTRIRIRVTFESAYAFRKITTSPSITSLPAPARHLIGEIQTDFRGRTLDFTRTITASRAIPGAVFLPDSRLQDHRMRYVLHLPNAATRSNATLTEDSSHTLIWDIPLAEALRSPFVTRFEMPVPVPWALLSAIAIPVSLSCGFLAMRFRRLRRRGPSFPLKNSGSP